MTDNGQSTSYSEEEIASKKRDKARTETKLSNARNAKKKLERKLERLKAAKLELETENENSRTLRNNLRDTIDLKRDWKGKNYTSCIVADGNSLKSQIEYAHKHIVNAALDDLNVAIMNVENQIYEKAGLIGELAKHLNYLTTWLENVFN